MSGVWRGGGGSASTIPSRLNLRFAADTPHSVIFFLFIKNLVKFSLHKKEDANNNSREKASESFCACGYKQKRNFVTIATLLSLLQVRLKTKPVVLRRGPGVGGTPLQEANGDVPLDGVAFFTTGMTMMGSQIFGFWG